MNIKLISSLLAVSLIACPLLYIFVGPALDAGQMETLKVLGIICGCSALYCFVVGELTQNNSQMDKLWSLLPIAYAWVIDARAGMPVPYKLKFWEGEEDYRWVLLRSRKEFQPHWKWMLFNFFFISIYQNVLVLLTTLPALVLMNSDKPFGWLDGVVAALMLGFIIYETVADEQQWAFQTAKWKMIKAGKKLEELPSPLNLGFNTTGLWGVSRHPNYFAEQAVWCCFYLFTVAGGIGLVNWSMIGALLLIVLFLGSSAFAEEISASKYPEYARYCQSVSRFFPGKKSFVISK